MKRSLKRMATKWMSCHVDVIASSEIPEEILDSLCLHTDDDLYNLAGCMAWNRMIAKLIEYKLTEDGEINNEILQSEIKFFMSEYRKANFPQYRTVDDFMEATIIKILSMLEMIRMRYRGLIAFEEFELWETVDKSVASFVGKGVNKTESSPTFKKIVNKEIQERDIREIILELALNGEKDKAKELLKKYKDIVARIKH